MRKSSKRPPRRRGVILVLTAFLLVFMLIVIAVAIDIGYLELAKTQLQESADAAALAATAELIDNDALTGVPNMSDNVAQARTIAVQYAAFNRVCMSAPAIDPNSSNSTSGDVVIGYLSNPSDPTQAMNFSLPNQANAVQVRVQRSTSENGEVGLFFARIFGSNSQAVKATATAAIMNSFVGFQAPADGSNLMIMPFALDLQTWNNMLAGSGTDNWSWDPTLKVVTSGSDNIQEVNLFPQGTGSPGNRGTVDIGSNNNSTATIERQILYGITPADLANLPGGNLAFNSQGVLYLGGNPGISAGMKDDLASVIGQPRIIPIFSSVSGPGNNAQYTIVAFAGVRIMNVKLTGSMSSKQVLVQPANITTAGGIAGSSQSSYFVYSPPWLVR
jgi:Flp pilus assembly protein TadG